MVTTVDVVRLDRTGWRVSAPPLEEDGSSRLIGYVERLARDRYEVLWLGSPPGWAYVNSLEDALHAVSDRVHFTGTICAERDAEVPAARAPRLGKIRRRQLQ